MKSMPADNTSQSEDFRTLDAQGFLVFKNAISESWLTPLRTIFDSGITPSADWPVPRGHEWRHSSVDQFPLVQQLCRLPAIIDSVRHILRGPFFLSQVEGREPCIANRPQLLHRDGAGSPGKVMAAMVWLDDYSALNGATRIIPGSHRPYISDVAEEDAIIMEGRAGDILLFDPEVLHGATSNSSGEHRRSLLILYAAASLQEEHQQTEKLRHVRMDSSEIFT